jgi:hypothetical protein
MNREARIDQAARRLITDRHIGPRARCFICGRKLTDRVSISYGIDLECWRDVLAAIHGPDKPDEPYDAADEFSRSTPAGSSS